MESLKIEKGMALDEVISILTRNLIDFAIHLVLAVMVFYAGRFIIRKIFSLVKKLMVKRNVDPSITTFVLSGLQITLYFLLVIIIVGILGLETSSFVALFASAGVAIGMALSGTMQNFAGGVLILILRPYEVGNTIEAQGYMGVVKAIQLFNTIITTPDNKTIIIPNGPLFSGTINNYSKQPNRRVEWIVSVAYDTDFDIAKSVIMSILSESADIIRDNPEQPVEVYIKELANSSVNITARAWAPESKFWSVFFAVNEHIYKKLPAAGVQFPFPQMDVHIKE